MNSLKKAFPAVAGVYTLYRSLDGRDIKQGADVSQKIAPGDFNVLVCNMFLRLAAGWIHPDNEPGPEPGLLAFEQPSHEGLVRAKIWIDTPICSKRKDLVQDKGL